MKPNPRILLLLPLFVVLPACERDDGSATLPSKSGRAIPRLQEAPQPDPGAEISRTADRGPAERSTEERVSQIYHLADDELGLLLESVCAHADPEARNALMVAVYEGTMLRPDLVRFPVLLEMARQPELNASLRTTILAELGTAVAADHGSSWADWAMALDEHLATTEGLLRVQSADE